MGGKGLIPSRQRDSFGIGYYYLALSDKVGPIARMPIEDNEQGVEIYYKIATTPWLIITPSIQAISPLTNDTDTTWVAGIRLAMAL